MTTQRKTIIASLVGIVCIGFLFFASQGSNTTLSDQSTDKSQSEVQKQSADKVQVFLFHATQRCATCIAIGKLAGETVYEYFQPELRDGKIEFREVNIDLPENKALAQKFQASGSSLFINAIRDGKDNISEDLQVWRLTSNEEQFKSYLRNKLNTLFGN
jgi:hypothetical protein